MEQDKTLIDIYKEVKDCRYKGEYYSVRDNGAVFRHCNGSALRPLDERWTFGKKNNKNGYMFIGSHRVHIIVATAFYGVNDSSKYVVDHIDTNRCNNRKENLRWLTKLENALSNPITRKRIEYLCGDINNFIANPSCLRDLGGKNKDIMWMRTVSAEEAKNCYERLTKWASANSALNKRDNHIAEWVYSPMKVLANGNFFQKIKPTQEVNDSNLYSNGNIQSVQVDCHIETNNLYSSLTPNAKQLNWRTPTKFPLCPSNINDNAISDYYLNLAIGSIVSENKYSQHFIDEFKIINETLVVRTHTQNQIKNYSIIDIKYEDGYFIHGSDTFFEEKGARKYFCKRCEIEWTEGDCMDDYT